MGSETFNMVVRVPKEESAFLHFMLEANEGLCFYSTLCSSLNNKDYRDIEIGGSQTLEPEFRRLFEMLREKLKLQILDKNAVDAERANNEYH